MKSISKCERIYLEKERKEMIIEEYLRMVKWRLIIKEVCKNKKSLICIKGNFVHEEK